LRRRRAGQALAHHEGNGVLDRRVGAVGDLLVVAAMVAVLEHGGEIAADAGHPPCADRFDPSLLDGVEDGAGGPALGRLGAVEGRIVTGEPQRQRVADSAGDRDVAAGQLARRLGHLGLMTGQARPVGGEGDLEVRLAGDRPHAADDGALERLGRSLDRRFRLDVVRSGHRASGQLRTTLAADWGSSSLKAR